jgi:hypothetical protein
MADASAVMNIGSAVMALTESAIDCEAFAGG